MAPTRYGDMSHWMMLKATTITPKNKRSKTPVRLMITVNTKVDRPKIMANVPTIESRSFHMFIFLAKRWMVKGVL